MNWVPEWQEEHNLKEKLSRRYIILLAEHLIHWWLRSSEDVTRM